MSKASSLTERAQGRTPRARKRLGRPGTALLALALVLPLSLGHATTDTPPPRLLAKAADGITWQKTDTMQIRMTINGQSLTASLDDSATSRDFISLLPMTIELADYAATEKIAYLPRKLATAGAPAGADPSVGDIAYYEPWGNLVIYYKDFGYSNGLIKLGRIDTDVKVLSVPGPLTVTIERSKP